MTRKPVYILAGVVFTMSLFAETGAAESPQLYGKLQNILAEQELRTAANYAGQDRALICSYCHGEDGNSVKSDVPNLAGQNPEYLLDQIGRFARGERKDYVMNSLASEFTEMDQINLAVFYSSKQVRVAVPSDPKQAIRGKEIYTKDCQGCHGKKGMGNTGYARLAGQKTEYISNTLTRFRKNAKLGKAHPGVKRHSPVMEPIASQLSDQQIQQLAAFLSSLK